MLYKSSGNIVNVPKNKLVVLQGLKDYIVVESDNILLVCKKEDEQQIKEFVSDIKHTKDKKGKDQKQRDKQNNSPIFHVQFGNTSHV